jgi:Protein of unknown function (DUF2786)
MAIDKLHVVRRLLAKADAAATPEEADAYTAKAMELMARHGIDAAVAAAAAPGRDEPGLLQVTVQDPYSPGKARLLAWTAEALRCRAVLHQLPGGRVTAVSIVGFGSDRERVELLYTSLLLQATGQLTRLRPPWRGESVAAYRRSWLHGFAVTVGQRLRAAEEAAVRERDEGAPPGGTSVALVLADRSQRVERAYAEEFPQVHSARRTTLSGTGFGEGVAAGALADLGGPAVDAGGRQALGA